jgi:hypothetical protein
MIGRQGRRRMQLLDDLKEKWKYWKLKEEALVRPMWRTHFGRGYGPVVRQTTEWMKYWHFISRADVGTLTSSVAVIYMVH